MTTVTIYDPAMCCSTGICGAEVDQVLVSFAADLDWLKSEGVSVVRYSLSQEPAEFAGNADVNAVLQKDGVDGLPVIILDGALVSSGRYPARGELADLTGIVLGADSAEAAAPAAPAQKSGCCGGGDGGGDNAEEAASGCC